MELTKITQELLFEHECVTIPRFGAFITRYASVSIKKNQFYPQRKEITFNALLVSNDGIVAHYLAQKEDISFEQALRLIEKEVSSWKRKLQTQKLIFPEIGEIRLNPSKKMEFTPYGIVNFDTKAYGLEMFTRKPLPVTVPQQPKIKTIMDTKDKEKIMFSLDSKEPKKQPFLKYTAISILTVGLIGAVYYFGDQYVINQQSKQTEIAQNKIKGKVQKATFDLGYISPIELNIDANEDYSPYTTTTSSNYGTYYSVIAGSFRSLKNANKLVNSLIKEGYKAVALPETEDGLFRVAYGRFTSKREAINLLVFLRDSLKEDAWFLIEN